MGRSACETAAYHSTLALTSHIMMIDWLMFTQGDHSYGKPGNFRDFHSCQSNVRDFTKSQGSVKEKILSGKSGLKLFTVSCIFASIPVFSSTSMIWVALNMGRSAANCQWISHCVESFTLFANIILKYMWKTKYWQGAYNSGKHGNLSEFVNSGKLREFKITRRIYQILFFHDAIYLLGIELYA